MFKIDILLATYNGEKYLKEQLDSLFSQTFQDFKIIIRDDQSSDKTLEIIKEYQMAYRNRIELLEDDLGNLKSSKSFMKLLEYSTAEYIMFCDQDDVWLPNKIKLSLNKIQKLEIETNKKMPLLVFTDLRVVEENLSLRYESMLKQQKMNPTLLMNNYYSLISQNPIAGCTMMCNKYVKKIVVPFPNIGIIHDHWIGLNTSYFGKIGYISEQTILYRQHNDSQIGNKNFDIKYIFNRLKNIKYTIRHDIDILQSVRFPLSYMKYIYTKVKLNLYRLRS